MELPRSECFAREVLEEANVKLDNLFKENTSIDYDEVTISRLLFRSSFDISNKEVVYAHAKILHKQLKKALSDSFLKEEAIFIELAKDITKFFDLTNLVSMESTLRADNIVVSQSMFCSVISSYKKHVPVLHQGDIDFIVSPFKLRMAIEIYFKNMIGLVGAGKIIKSGRHKGKHQDLAISISKLLRFFDDDRYRKYANIPMSMDVLKDINWWSNSFVHSGIICFSWQTLEAVSLLWPLFYTERKEDGARSLDGFNYLDRTFDAEDLKKDLEEYFSGRNHTAVFYLKDRIEKPVEGIYYR